MGESMMHDGDDDDDGGGWGGGVIFVLSSFVFTYHAEWGSQ